MSGDDIVFEDVKHREPRRKRRPDLDRRCACVAYHIPAPDDLPIFLDNKAADAIERHALRDTSVELGGVLLGWECVDDVTGKPFVWITQSLEAKHYENTQASFTYTHDAWEAINRERDEKHADLDIVGWYHTHPDFGIFLSGHDLFIHRRFFDLPLQVAYVVDPIRQTRGFFQWRNGDLHPLSGFYLSGDRGDRIALARLANDLENIPNADAPGGGISPRLEAELINMMSRPQYPPPQIQNNGPVALLFLILGLMAGILGYIAFSWVATVQNTLTENTRTLEYMKGERDLAVGALKESSSRSGIEPFSRKELELSAKNARLESTIKDIEAKYKLDNDQRLAMLKQLDDSRTIVKERDNLKAEVQSFKDLRREHQSLLDDLKRLQTKDDSPTGFYYRWYSNMRYVVLVLLAVCGWMGWLLLQKYWESSAESPQEDPYSKPGGSGLSPSGIRPDPNPPTMTIQ